MIVPRILDLEVKWPWKVFQMAEWWTWATSEHPRVIAAIAGPATDLGWCDRLERAAEDAVVGKVLCVSAARAVAREVLGLEVVSAEATRVMDLLGQWIDDPTDERFERICDLTFGENLPEFDKHGVVWWALRTATSSVGNFEGGWALASACGAAEIAGFGPEQLRSIVARELVSRMAETEP